MAAASDSPTGREGDMKLFWACLIALVATSFVFGVRSALIGEIGADFGLSQTEKGEILGVGLWPFALSIIVFSLIIDKIGYKTAAIFAVACHLIAIILTLNATGFRMLYWGTFIVALGNGAVEAFINPVVATVFPKEKAKWLNILHAGWPAGIALGVIFIQLLGFAEGLSWKMKFGMCFLPVVLYALLILKRAFPVQERVAAGVTYRDMLREVGFLGFFIIGVLVVMGVVQMTGKEIPLAGSLLTGLLIAAAAGFYTRSIGNPLFILILLTMGPLATTELGTDTWMIDLLEIELPKAAPWILAYSAVIMTVLRCYAGPIVHKFSPIGLLVLSAAVAILGLLFFSKASGLAWIVAAATVYALGKTFLWSTTLGLVSEQFPRGGALTLNGVSAVGVLGMGLIGSPGMGYYQDKQIEDELKTNHPALFQQVAGSETPKIFGLVTPVDPDKKALLPEADQEILSAVEGTTKKANFARVAVLPAFMLLVYAGIFLYFRSRGGYRPRDVAASH